MRIWRFYLIAALLLAAILAGPGFGSEPTAWKDIPRPDTEQGLIYQPRLCSIKSRVHLLWAGTSAKVRKPELYHTSISDGDDHLGTVRAPFFGSSLSRVRRISVGNARDLLGILFQRATRQGGSAYEIMLTISADQGWSFSRPYTIDSFVAENEGGTWVAIDGREGTNRPEFAAAWAAENRTIRAANIDIKSNRRPRAASLGQHSADCDKVEVASCGEAGFAVVWNGGGSLKTANIKPLTGGAGETDTLLKGNFGALFTVAGWPKGPAAAMAVEGGQARTLRYERKWEDLGLADFPLSSSQMECRSDLDDDKMLHVALYTGVEGGNKIYYLHQTEKGWSAPELVMELVADLDCSGFDIAASSDSLWVVASQANRFYMKTRKKG